MNTIILHTAVGHCDMFTVDDKLHCGKCGSALVQVEEGSASCAGTFSCPTCSAFSHPVHSVDPVHAVHPPPPPFIKLGVTAVIRNGFGQILLGLKARAFSPELLNKWVTPGGRVNCGETLEAAIRREVREETGLEISLTRTLSPQELIHHLHHFVFIVFEAQSLGGRPEAADDISDLHWFDRLTIQALRSDLTPLTLKILDSLS